MIIERMDNMKKINKIIKCVCGCEKTLLKYDKYGRERRFIFEHRHYITKVEDQFWPHVKKTDGCWIWMAGKTSAGYGTMCRHKKRLYAHRISYELHCGKIPKGKHVLHKCDNPSCVNPEHLFLGNPLINAHDKIRKGRQPGAKACLTDKEIAEIRKLSFEGSSNKKIAELFNVSQPYVSRVINFKRRENVTSLFI